MIPHTNLCNNLYKDSLKAEKGLIRVSSLKFQISVSNMYLKEHASVLQHHYVLAVLKSHHCHLMEMMWHFTFIFQVECPRCWTSEDILKPTRIVVHMWLSQKWQELYSIAFNVNNSLFDIGPSLSHGDKKQDYAFLLQEDISGAARIIYRFSFSINLLVAWSKRMSENGKIKYYYNGSPWPEEMYNTPALNPACV